MDDQFWLWLNRYQPQDSLKKLTILKTKYLNNETNINYIHVTGTNGKGSVSRYLQQVMFQGLNHKVGLFTSPHILAINERIVINNQMISDEDLMRIKNLIAQDVDQYQLGFFAILTLIALIYFQEQRVAWAVIEVGIGGLWDATNIIKSDYCVITSIAKDHVEVLGNSCAKILQEKLGIVKKSTKTLFVTGNIKPNLQAQILANTKCGIKFSEKLPQATYYHQNQNLAFTIITSIFSNLKHNIAQDIITNTKINLRFETFNYQNKTLYFDVAHNLAGIKALIRIIKINKIKIDQIIFSALVNKNPEILLQQLTKITNNIIICRNQHPKSVVAPSFDWQEMIEKNDNGNILITGSCYFAADIYNQLITKQK